MKPAWDQLGDEFKDSAHVVIGDVDCTIHKDVCTKYGVRGYPTIKYFTDATPADGEKYAGGRDFNALKTFVDANLGPSCGFDHRELCDADQLAILDAGIALSADDLAAAIAEKTAAIAAAEAAYAAEMRKISGLQAAATKAKEEAVNAVKPSLGLYKSIKPAAGKDEL